LLPLYAGYHYLAERDWMYSGDDFDGDYDFDNDDVIKKMKARKRLGLSECWFYITDF
jgi:hypothetical protein